MVKESGRECGGCGGGMRECLEYYIREELQVVVKKNFIKR